MLCSFQKQIILNKGHAASKAITTLRSADYGRVASYNFILLAVATVSVKLKVLIIYQTQDLICPEDDHIEEESNPSWRYSKVFALISYIALMMYRN